MAPRIIMRQKTRILLPHEYQMLRKELSPGYQILCDALLHTGLRIVEFWALYDNPHWYHPSSRVIDLPEEGATKKEKCEVTDRTIKLTAAGAKAMDILFAVKPQFKERDAMRGALRRAAERAGLGSKGISPKMFRKWLVSYLVECRKDLGIEIFDVCSNMGHDDKTLRRHYQGVFVPADHQEIYEFVKGWNG